jgi:gamma-glutamylcysteine synthetase
MQVIKCWDIQAWDGGEHTNHAFYIASEAEKDVYMKTHTYDSAYERTFIIFDTLEEMSDNTKAKIKERALAKLTIEERAILGY